MIQDSIDLALLQRDGLLTLFAFVLSRDEPRYTGGISDDKPALVVHLHLDENITGEDTASHRGALAFLNLDFFFRGDDHLEYLVPYVHRLDTQVEVLLYAIFLPGIGMDDVPASLGLFGGTHEFT